MSTELAWLIERRDYGGGEYLSGEASGYFPTWTKNFMEAIHFSRRIDAERIAGIFDDLDIHVCEHGWDGAASGWEEHDASVLRKLAQDFASPIRDRILARISKPSSGPGRSGE